MFRDLFQGIDIPVIYTGIELPVIGFDHHYLCAFLKMDLFSILIQHTVIMLSEADAVAAVHGPLCEDCQDEVYLFRIRLRFKYRSDTIEWKRELQIEFLYVGV